MIRVKSIFTSIVTLSSFFLLSCEADPGLRKVPKEEKVIVDKGLNNVVFNPKVDILFIIDDSGSMGSFQKELASNARLFIDKFFQSKFIDYHIGVTTSTYNSFSGSKLVYKDGYNFVDRQTIDGQGVLSRLMRVGSSGSATEQFFSVHLSALSPQMIAGANAGFYREEAHLAIFVLTDTEDQSGFGVDESYDFLLGLKKRDEQKLHYSAALAQQSPACRGESQAPRKLTAMVTKHKDRGIIFDLCKKDYGDELAEIAERLVESVSTLYLDELPDVTTLEVSYGDTVIPNSSVKGWLYSPEKNAIILSKGIEIKETDQEKLRVKFEPIYKAE